MRIESYLPCKKIYLSLTTRKTFFQALIHQENTACMYITLFSLSSAWVLDFLAAGKSGESHCTSKVHYKRATGLPKNLLSYHRQKYWPHEKVAINNDPLIPRINHNTILYFFKDTCDKNQRIHQLSDMVLIEHQTISELSLNELIADS